LCSCACAPGAAQPARVLAGVPTARRGRRGSGRAGRPLGVPARRRARDRGQPPRGPWSGSGCAGAVPSADGVVTGGVYGRPATGGPRCSTTGSFRQRVGGVGRAAQGGRCRCWTSQASRRRTLGGAIGARRRHGRSARGWGAARQGSRREPPSGQHSSRPPCRGPLHPPPVGKVAVVERAVASRAIHQNLHRVTGASRRHRRPPPR